MLLALYYHRCKHSHSEDVEMLLILQNPEAVVGMMTSWPSIMHKAKPGIQSDGNDNVTGRMIGQQMELKAWQGLEGHIPALCYSL